MTRTPAADQRGRADRLAAAVAAADRGADPAALLVTDDANLRWLTGFTGSAGAALLLPDGPVLLTDARYEGRVTDECGPVELLVTRSPLRDAVRRAVAAGMASLLFESAHLSHADARRLQARAADDGLDCVATTGVVEQLRTVKDEVELALLARACAVTEQALDAALAGGLVGRTERAVARRVEDEMRDRDAAVGFPTIVASGPNGAVPHHAPGERTIATGDLVTIDCGAAWRGYHADTTRTVLVGGAGPSSVLREAFSTVAAAQQAGVAAAVAGATAGAVDAAARDVITAAGMGEWFVHGTGHGVGLRIHEAPAVAPGSTASLAAGTPLTVEPGVYLPGRGGVRIEDTVVVTDDGPARRLTRAPHTLVVV